MREWFTGSPKTDGMFWVVVRKIKSKSALSDPYQTDPDADLALLGINVTRDGRSQQLKYTVMVRWDSGRVLEFSHLRDVIYHRPLTQPRFPSA